MEIQTPPRTARESLMDMEIPIRLINGAAKRLAAREIAALVTMVIPEGNKRRLLLADCEKPLGDVYGDGIWRDPDGGVSRLLGELLVSVATMIREASALEQLRMEPFKQTP